MERDTALTEREMTITEEDKSYDLWLEKSC